MDDYNINGILNESGDYKPVAGVPQTPENAQVDEEVGDMAEFKKSVKGAD